MLGGLPPPQVEVFCIHGSEVFIYSDGGDNDNHDDHENDDKDIVTIVIEVNTTERVIYPPGSFPPALSPSIKIKIKNILSVKIYQENIKYKEYIENILNIKIYSHQPWQQV